MTHHGAALRKLKVKEETIQALAHNWKSACLSPADAALCAWAEKLTRRPNAMSQEDVERLRRVGLSDRAILDACLVITYFNFVTRLAQGLGVELESYWRANEILRPSRRCRARNQ